MEANENTIKLYYNTEVEKLQMQDFHFFLATECAMNSITLKKLNLIFLPESDRAMVKTFFQAKTAG